MVASLSKAMSQGALERYHSKDNYYSQNEGLENSQWQGQFAEHQNLTGPIALDDWKHACQGQDPQGNELRRKQTNSRAGWDITLSASKSASLKALIDRDRNVLDAHRAAVGQTVQYIEQHCIYAQIKDQGQLKREQTQKGQFALFEHDDNRKQEPQLHTHVVVLNQTLCQDGKTRTLDSRELFIQKKTIGAYYDHAFAHQLSQKGFDIEWTSDHTFEIKGYRKDQLEAFSGRRQQIREHLAKQNIELERATEEQKAIACLESRPIKVHKLRPIDHEQQRERWKQESNDLGIIHPQPHLNLERQYDLNPHPGSLTQAIQDGIESATAYQVATSRQVLLRECLRQAQSYYSPVEIEQTLDRHPDLIPTQDGRLTTARSLQREQFILQTANAGKGTQPPLATVEQITAIAQQKGLNEGQQNGLTHIATSADFITLLQGDAGVGKTYTLNAFKDCLMNPSDRLQGLAPSAAAAETLATETGIPATTVEGFLLSPNQTTGRILLVDESGMVSSQQMERLIRKAQEQQSRLILVGDIKQLSAVEAGAPFRLLQSRSQLKTVAIEQNVRQRVPHLFDAASLAAQHRTNEALSRLDHCDCIREIRNPAHRNQTVVEQYLAREPREQAQTLILCDTNQDRRDITRQIRDAYIANGILGQDARTLQILYPKSLDKQAIAQVYNYAVGDVIRFHRPSKQFPDLYYRVSQIKDDTLMLKDRLGQVQEMAIAQYKDRDVFQCQPLDVRVGDRLRFTRNHRERNQTNGQPYTIEALHENGSVEIRTKGQRYTVAPDQLLHSDYAYCRTVYSAQGWTSAEAIWAPGQNPGREQTYVALTRAKETLQIITLDREALGLSVQQSQAQENAIELIHPEPQTHPIQIDAPQQLTLFPGQSDDLERKIKPRAARSQPTQRTARPSPNTAEAPELRDGPSQVQQTSGQTGQAEPTRATDGLSAPSDIAPVRSRFAKLDELARNIRNDGSEVGRTAGTSNPNPEPDEAVLGTDADPASDHRELQYEPEPVFPAVPEPRERTAAIETGNSIAETTATGIDPTDESGVKPDQGIHSQTGESLEPDTSHAQQSGPQYKGGLNSIDHGDRLDKSIGDGISGVIPERSIQPDSRADEWESEQPTDPDEQTLQALEIEDPTAQQLQQSLAIAQNWSDEQLLSVAAEVQDYFKQPPPEPDGNRAKQLHDDLERFNALDLQLRDTASEQRQALETLGPARSWNYLLGSDPKKVKAAEQRLEQTTTERAILGRRIQITQSTFKVWQQEARTYIAWRDSEKGEQMHLYRDIVKLEPVQERISQIHRTQEANRQAQERQRQKQKGLEVLKEWKEVAIELGRPERHVQIIQEITEAYWNDTPLKEIHRNHMTQDFEDYQERQIQIQSQNHGRSFSR
jgi:conjugative relaxase-like TrwC/TraI family protein